MSKKSRFKTPFESKHDKGSQRLLKPARQHFNQIFSSLLWKQLKNVSFTFILGLFVHILIEDDKYYLLNRENLLQPIQMPLSKKQKYFSKFFPPFLKSSSNLEHFKTKDDPHSLCISEIKDSEKRG